MTNQEIILQLSEVIAEQKKQISRLESSNEYLRKELEKMETQVKQISADFESLQKTN